ncbi:MAG TPA: cellulose synthase subunit BcsC-related outer membrane protein, partial [Nevskiaceae bacterium]|nr:cellulose synthase subunit BcsC-related outer membrane protein [Nevskiaceae bacterium]
EALPASTPPPRYPLPQLAPPGMALNKPRPPEPPPTSLKLDLPESMQQPGGLFGSPAVPLRMDPVLRSRNYAFEQAPVLETPEDSILAQIAEIESKRSASFGAGLSLRSRDGREGLDQLDDIEGPLEASFAGIDAGRFTARVWPVYIEAGTVRGSNLPLLGQVALIPDVSGRVDQSDKGVALGLQYEVEDFSIDVGSTPIGFEVERFVGGVEWKPKLGDWILGLDISRRSVTDSLLSFAGTEDPRTGAQWGAITATGARLDVAYDFGNAGVYANGEFHVYDGKNVAKNDEVGGGAGAYLHVMQKPTQRVTVGVNFTSFFFDDNLRHFTWGHGGYFSPQRYISFAIPIEWAGGTRRLSWSLAAALGIQNFHEDAEALFPNDPALQAAVEEAAEDDPALAAGYDEQSQTGAGASLYGQIEYLISQHLVVGASAAFDNARDYDETKVLAYVRWYVGKQAQVSRPPRPVVPFYDFPKRIP